MKITFIYPAIGICGFDKEGRVEHYGGETCWISHGLASIATVSKCVADVSLIDMRRLKSWNEFEDKLEESDWFGLSISRLNYDTAKCAKCTIKAKFPNAKIVVGGFDPSMYPKKYEWADKVIIGEGEQQILDLLDEGKQVPVFKWIDREMWDYQLEMNYPFTSCMKTPMVTMIAGRGCPYNCAYCQPAESIVHKKYWTREVDDVLGELDFLKKNYNFKSVLFWDDTFALNRDWVSGFCKGFKEIGGQLVINCRADLISHNEDMMKGLKEAGLHMVLVGIESGSQRLLNLINKGTRVNQNVKTAKICKELGVKLFATFMLGLPTETSAESLSTMQHIQEIKPDYVLPFYYTPIPGTDLHDYCKEKDLILNGSGTIERTGKFEKTLKGVDYDFLDKYIGRANFHRKEVH